MITCDMPAWSPQAHCLTQDRGQAEKSLLFFQGISVLPGPSSQLAPGEVCWKCFTTCVPGAEVAHAHHPPLWFGGPATSLYLARIEGDVRTQDWEYGVAWGK